MRGASRAFLLERDASFLVEEGGNLFVLTLRELKRPIAVGGLCCFWLSGSGFRRTKSSTLTDARRSLGGLAGISFDSSERGARALDRASIFRGGLSKRGRFNFFGTCGGACRTAWGLSTNFDRTAMLKSPFVWSFIAVLTGCPGRGLVRGEAVIFLTAFVGGNSLRGVAARASFFTLAWAGGAERVSTNETPLRKERLGDRSFGARATVGGGLSKGLFRLSRRSVPESGFRLDIAFETEGICRKGMFSLGIFGILGFAVTAGGR